MDTDLKELERRTHRAHSVRKGLEGLGSGAVAGGLTAAALRATGVKADPTLMALGGAAAGGLTGLAAARNENLKDRLRETRTDTRYLNRHAFQESMRQARTRAKHSAFAAELLFLLEVG